DLPGMNVFEGASDLEGDSQLVAELTRVAALDGVTEVFALEMLHHHERALLVVFAEIVNTEDVVVGDVAGHARLGQEAGLGFGILAAGFGENLDGHGAADDGIAGAVHVGHPAAQELFELVLADSGGKLHVRHSTVAGGRRLKPAAGRIAQCRILFATRTYRRRLPSACATRRVLIRFSKDEERAKSLRQTALAA